MGANTKSRRNKVVIEKIVGTRFCSTSDRVIYIQGVERSLTTANNQTSCCDGKSKSGRHDCIADDIDIAKKGDGQKEQHTLKIITHHSKRGRRNMYYRKGIRKRVKAGRICHMRKPITEKRMQNPDQMN